MSPTHIAVLGGGLTGLSSAFHLSRRFPLANITLIDKQKSLGGWASKTERVQLPGGRGSVLLEGGPRTLRPNAKSALELIHLLGLQDSVLTTPKSSPAAKKRFLHVPGTPGIYEIPGLRLSYLWNELRFFISPGVSFELIRGWNRPKDILDESFESFLTRRGHPVTARVLGSALVHGIYAADARLLSVRAAFPKLWELEEKGKGRILWGLLTRSKKDKEEERLRDEEDSKRYELGDVTKLMDGTAVYSFRDGMSTLPKALARAIDKNPKIRVLSDTKITSLRLDEEQAFEITTNKTSPILPSHVVSALPLPVLYRLLPESHSLPYLTTNPFSSVTAVNLVFPSDKIYPPGFGYLVCRPEDDYKADDAGILGVTFDSNALPGQDDLTPGTRLTKVTRRNLPVVLAHLQYHLNRRAPLPEPLVVKKWEHRACIPTPLPGHLERMNKLREALVSEEGPWRGRLEVVGAGVKGVSVGDCLESGKTVGMEW
ncbi:hypothetical protein FB45DRAFT_886881 [Roridomyces roridus]|uniref:Protoporphyrinogen oxidase n=1 Tax=Roridomyces roridus TaxID=1738132 RepID=A0AAD7CIR2_9AGAR|nr:hypothetical protein FB45DRAFT_886881 [Roridomyces roridus]